MVGVAVSFAVIEIAGVHSFNDTVIEMKVAEQHRGKQIYENEVELVVKKDAFVIGREMRDILWPPNCLIVTVIKNPEITKYQSEFHEGDMLRVHYRTTDPEETATRLEELVGDQREAMC